MSGELEAVFAEQRSFLWGYCYRLTGDVAAADDTVQDTFVRALESPPRDTTLDWRPWLVRVATNLVRDRWRGRREWTGLWLPGPLETNSEGQAVSPWRAGAIEDSEARITGLESVSYAFLLALELLTPKQRAVLLLRDVYDYSTAETAAALDLGVSAVKTTLHRARQAIGSWEEQKTPLDAVAVESHRRMLGQLMECWTTGDIGAMEQLLAGDVEALGDSNGRFHAARKPVVGRQKVALFFQRIGEQGRNQGRSVVTPCMVNGLPAIWVESPDAPEGLATRFLFRLDLDGEGLIRRTYSILSPEKFAGVQTPAPS